MKRVAFLSEHASPLALLGGQDAGGQNVYVDEVARNLAKLGWQVDIFTRRDDAELPDVIEWAPGVRIVNISAGPASFVVKDQLWPFMAEFRDGILRFIRREHLSYDVLHGNFWMSGWAAVEIGRALDVPVVQIFHATGRTKRREQGSADTSPDIRDRIELRVLEDAARVIAQCPAEEDELVNDYGADPRKVVVIPSAVNVDVFRPVDRGEARKRLGLDPELPLAVYVGRMLPRKDVRNVVRALAAVSDHRARLLVVGGETRSPDPGVTPEIGELQRLAAELGVSQRVAFTGKRQPDELRWYYSAADVAVTTPWYEPFGLTPLEGQACGRPVIGSAVGGITYTIADCVTGFLVPPREPEALAQRLDTLFADRPLGERMGQAARERVLSEFTWPTVAERTARLYDEVVETNVSPPRAVAAGVGGA